jgi:phosphoribosylformylglycinamidine synthase
VALSGDPFVDLFSESAARVLVTVAAEDADRLVELAHRHGVPLGRLGATGGGSLVVAGQFAISLEELRDAWTATLPAALG